MSSLQLIAVYFTNEILEMQMRFITLAETGLCHSESDIIMDLLL